MNYLNQTLFTARDIAVIPFRAPHADIWPSGRRLGALWVLTTLGPEAVVAQLRVLAAVRFANLIVQVMGAGVAGCSRCAGS